MIALACVRAKHNLIQQKLSVVAASAQGAPKVQGISW